MKIRGKTVCVIGFVFYLQLLVYLVLFKLDLISTIAYRYRELMLIPYFRPGAINMRTVVEELVMNVAAFIPLGMYLSMLKLPKKIWARILAGFGLSLAFETAQYVFAIGTSDVTDLINNTLGTAIGVLVYFVIKKLLREKALPVTAWTLLGIQILALSAYMILWGVNI